MTPLAPGALDVEAYLRRIDYNGPLSPTLGTLRALQARHVEAIAFESLNPLLGWPVPLDLPSLQEKLVRGGRGGYCFEHNLLFSHVLTALGFNITRLAARVLWGMAEEAIRPRGHMLLRVDLDGVTYVTDVGFGRQTLTGPLRLELDVEQLTPHEPFRFVRVDDDYKMQSYVGGEWRSLYRFDLQPQHEVDYEFANAYLAAHPSSPFRAMLMAARATPDRRYGLANNQLSIHFPGGPPEHRVLGSVAEVRETLEKTFGLTLPAGPELDAALARVCDFPR